MALLGMGDIHYNVCSSCGVLEVPWIHSGTLLQTILDYVGYIITELHGHLLTFGPLRVPVSQSMSGLNALNQG